MAYTNHIIEQLFQPFKPAIGKDYEKYRNHVYRVFLNCRLMDNREEEKYAIAAVFHDIGIWTDNTIDYLSPSIARANHYLTATGKQQWIEEITQMIYWHHKTGRYKGAFEQTVETFRRADWIDVSLGILSYGFNRSILRNTRKQLPNKGFHLFLIKKIWKNFFRHPLHPLPMFKS